jgi:hypothetical protein
MDKHGVSSKELALSAGITGVHAPAEPRREPSQRPWTYEYCGDAFAKEVFAGRGRRWRWDPFRRAVRVVAGYAAVGFGIWAIAAFHVTPYQQDHPNTYGQGVSKAEEPIIGDGANPSYHKGPVRYRRGTLLEEQVEYVGSPYIRPVPDY